MKNDVWAATQPAGLDEVLTSSKRARLLDAKVMMVDDEPLMTDLVQTYLEDEGYTNFVVVNDPLQALAMLRREEPSLLLLDLMMPGMSGFEVLEALRADRALRYTPVIVLTASTGAEAKLRALQLGATDFLSKPVDESELVLRVRNTLAFQQYHDQIVNFDPVTKLPLAKLFDRGLGVMLERNPLVGGLVSLFSIHVPDCRALRESIDRATSDGLAKALALRLDQFARDEQGSTAHATAPDEAPRVARLGEGQFGLLLEGRANADAVEATARRLLARMAEPLMLGLHEIVAQAWVGISVSPGDGNTVAALRQGADLAATHAQADGAARFKFSSPELNAHSYRKLALGSQLRGAAQRGELVLHYQPKVDFRTRRIVGAEALVRWLHPEHGLIAPARFIPLAEEMGLIKSLGEWVLEQACRDAAQWAATGRADLKVAINVAKPQFVSGDLCQVLRQALFDTGLPAERLVIELTESMLMDDVQAGLVLMHEVKALGVTLSIDDFGTGYSSLSYLKRFPLDELKIDRSFVMDLPGGQTDMAIVRTVIELGHSLGMTVTAEGIETEAQRGCLARLGCDTYQGFLYSRPVPQEALLRLLRPGRAAGTPGTA
jgi:EAL domain-containing protein (putative c-di-GMP-specific phosphodiesterase class I)/PleD family two-component response regulator